MIFGFTGEFRQGKTLAMTWYLIQAMYKGARVISNYPIEVTYRSPFGRTKKLKSECFTNGEEFRNKISTERNCIFGCDEASVYLPNEFWRGMPEELRFKFALNEHFDTTILYTVQEFNDTVARMRRLTNLIFQAHKISLGWFTMFRLNMYKKQFFDGMPTPAKHEQYFKGYRMIWPSDARLTYRAYRTKYEFSDFTFGEFAKKI